MHGVLSPVVIVCSWLTDYRAFTSCGGESCGMAAQAIIVRVDKLFRALAHRL